jgi:hypothetical protein
LAQSGHSGDADQCPLSEVKQTFCGHAAIPLNDPKRTFDLGALVTAHPQDGELAKEIAEYDCTVAWHGLFKRKIGTQIGKKNSGQADIASTTRNASRKKYQ